MSKIRIGVLSDQHMNVNGVNDLVDLFDYVNFIVNLAKKNKLDYFVFLGDMSWDLLQVKIFIELVSSDLKGVCKIRYIYGNHDLSKTLSKDKFLNPMDSMHLSVSPIVHKNKAFIGIEGFFDLEWFGGELSQEIVDRLLEHSNTRYFSDNKPHRKQDLNEIVEFQRRKLETQICSLAFEGITEISIGMHFVPKFDFVNKVDNDETAFKNAYMGSAKIGEAIDEHSDVITDVYFGHTHKRLGHNQINGVNYHCVPVGIRKDWIKHGYKETNLQQQTIETLQIIEWD